MMTLKESYQKKIVSQLAKKWGLKNLLAVPKVTKVVVSMGLGEAASDKKVIDPAVRDLRVLSGQQPEIRRARQAVAGFKIRQGDPVGLRVTLRGERMYAFLEKLFKIVLPRLRDFQGLSAQGFDQEGNYNLGVPEQIVFPEVDYSQVDKVRGLQITMVTNTDSAEKAKALLVALGLPLKKKDGKKSKNY